MPKGNPAGITGVADLAKPDVKVVVCAPEAPVRKYASQVFDAAKITVTPVSQEQNVKGVVTKVTAVRRMRGSSTSPTSWRRETRLRR